MSAKVCGYVVVGLCAALIIGAIVTKAGMAAIGILAGALAFTLAFVWATGAIIYEDWWPFRHL